MITYNFGYTKYKPHAVYSLIVGAVPPDPGSIYTVSYIAIAI